MSRERHGGHGSAMAQAYNHAILPLCDARDRWTQVRWGVRDFEHRFGREPEGMWLPETAVDVASLEALAQAGIAYTVLEPHQAKRWRPMGEGRWVSAQDGGVDTRRPYRCSLPSGRSIDLFFYDGATSRAVAFEGLLSSGVHFAERLLGGFADRPGPQIAHIATDGETYGHHHRFGDMALAYALRHVEEHGLATGISRGEPQGVGTDFSTRTEEIYAYATFRDRGDGNVSWDEVNAAYDWEFRGPGGQVRSGTMWIASGDQSTPSETRTYFASLGLHSGFANSEADGEWTVTVTRDSSEVYTDAFTVEYERPLWQEVGIYVAGALGIAGLVLVGIFVGLRTFDRGRRPDSA